VRFSDPTAETAEATIGFVDLSGFSALTEVHGDHQALAVLERFEDFVRAGMRGHGRLVKFVGDAAMITFDSPPIALHAVTAIVEAALSAVSFPLVRIGLHHGPVIERGDDLFGHTVNVTARIADHARGGQVLATTPIAEVATRLGAPTVALGAVALRNLTTPVPLFGVALGSLPGTSALVCRMRVNRHLAEASARHDGTDHWFCSHDCRNRFITAPAAYTPQRIAHDPPNADPTGGSPGTPPAGTSRSPDRLGCEAPTARQWD
jgi:adenylate cyclase